LFLFNSLPSVWPVLSVICMLTQPGCHSVLLRTKDLELVIVTDAKNQC
jgi:hypothetical protein